MYALHCRNISLVKLFILLSFNLVSTAVLIFTLMFFRKYEVIHMEQGDKFYKFSLVINNSSRNIIWPFYFIKFPGRLSFCQAVWVLLSSMRFADQGRGVEGTARMKEKSVRMHWFSVFHWPVSCACTVQTTFRFASDLPAYPCAHCNCTSAPVARENSPAGANACESTCSGCASQYSVIAAI